MAAMAESKNTPLMVADLGSILQWLDVAPAMLHAIDSEWRIAAVSDFWLRKTGYQRHEVVGRHTTAFLTADSRDHALNVVLPAFLATGRCENVDYQMVRADGRLMDIVLNAVMVSGAPGQAPFTIASLKDVTSEKEVKRELAMSEAMYRALIEEQNDLISLADVDGRLKFVNRRYAELHGIAAEDMIGRNLFDFIPKADMPAVLEHFRQAFQGGEILEIENQVVFPDGRKIWASWTNKGIRDQNGQVFAIHSVGRDITARKSMELALEESNRQLEILASEDGLTKLMNRRAFDVGFAKEMRRARRDRCPISFMIVDVDHFKLFNDTYGHIAGDECLRRIAQTIRDVTRRPADLVARYGGEEFVVLLPNTDEAGAAVIASNLMTRLAELAIEHAASPHRMVTVSVGVSNGLGTDPSLDLRLPDQADKALYEAKRMGRNRTLHFSEL